MKTEKRTEARLLDLRQGKLPTLKTSEVAFLERLAKITRGLIFATVEGARSGHPGGSSSKVEQFLTLALGGFLAFDPMEPKHPGRDRLVWSAGHCTPLLYGGQALFYEALRRVGRQFSEAALRCASPERLASFRRLGGLPGHAESVFPFSDYSTGPSGHGLSAAVGLAISHRACGLPTKIWVMMGDAESEEGMSFEARNLAAANGLDNLIVSVDNNGLGIDGSIEEVISSSYFEYWSALGWNTIEVDGHDFSQLYRAYELAGNGLGNGRPTAIIAHTIKGKEYGSAGGTSASHGAPAKREEYVDIMKKLGFKVKNEANAAAEIETVFDTLTDSDAENINKHLEVAAERVESEAALLVKMKRALSSRPMIDPREIKRPKTLPPELVFKAGDMVSPRRAAGLWLEWLMKQTAFFFVGAGDLSGSVQTAKAEAVYGLFSAKNPQGRGIRFGIAEANMFMSAAALTQDILPGGFRPISAFGTYGVFTVIGANPLRLAVYNNFTCPERAGFFISLASHDGPETAEDGPTHHGLFWHSLFEAYPGIKVYKPLDANDTVEMLFGALEKGKPIILSVPRVETPVFERGRGCSPSAAANLGAYIFQPFKNDGKKKITLAVCGGKLMGNLLPILPRLEKAGYDAKILAVTSPELFEELRRREPKKAAEIFPDEEREITVGLHNGWPGFLRTFILPPHQESRLLGVEQFLSSGSADEVYRQAGLDSDGLLKKILAASPRRSLEGAKAGGAKAG